MEGREVYKFAVTTIGKSIDNFQNKQYKERRYKLFHIPSGQYKDFRNFGKNLNISMDKFPSNIEGWEILLQPVFLYC